MQRLLRRAVVLAATTIGVLGIAAGASTAAPSPTPLRGAAGASAAPAPTISATPAAWTPQVTSADSTVRKMVQCGTTMFAVGDFSTIRQNGVTYQRSNAFSFDALTGAVTGWNPAPNGLVNTIAVSVNCATAYLGGVFTSTAGVAVRDLVAVTTSTGSVVPTFGHNTSGQVYTLQLVDAGAQLIAGGAFTSLNGTATPYLASLDVATGKVTSYLNLTVSGLVAGSTGRPLVYNQQLSPSGKLLLIEGSFTQVNGQPRPQLAEVDISASGVTLDPWFNTTVDMSSCGPRRKFYVRTAAFSPDEKTIYIATTGFRGTSPFCDAVTAFTNTAPATVIWENATGGDTLLSVAASTDTVFIGGHERWANNPDGADQCLTTCISRPGIGAISVSSGLATAWNPTRDRGHGADDMLLTPAGLWVASDTFYNSVLCGGQYHPGICFFPSS